MLFLNASLLPLAAVAVLVFHDGARALGFGCFATFVVQCANAHLVLFSGTQPANKQLVSWLAPDRLCPASPAPSHIES